MAADEAGGGFRPPVGLDAGFDITAAGGKAEAVLEAQHTQSRAVNARLEAGGGEDGNAAHAIGHRPAGAGIENVAITHAVELEAPEGIAGDGDAEIGYGETAPASAGLPGILKTDVPERVLAIAADGVEIAAEIDERILDAMLAGDSDQLIDRVFLAEAAEIQAHAGLREERPTPACAGFSGNR